MSKPRNGLPAGCKIGLFIWFCLLLVSCTDSEQSVEKIERVTTLRLVHDTESAPIIREAIRLFSERKDRLPDGSIIRIQSVVESAMRAQGAIANGKLKTELWLTPSLSLASFVNSNLSNLGPEQKDCVTLFESPMVAAVRSQSLSLLLIGTDEPTLPLTKLLDAHRFQSEGNKVGHALSISHATPRESASGLLAYLQLGILAAQSAELTVNKDFEWSAEIENKLKSFEQLASSYASRDRELLHHIALSTDNNIQLALTTEQQLILYNRQKEQDREALVAIYPEEQTLMQNYTLCQSAADWLSPAHKAAAETFAKFLSEEPMQLLALKQGFRPAVLQFEDLSPISQESGANASYPRIPLQKVSPQFTASALRNWGRVRRPAAAALVLDTSGSMEGLPSTYANQELRKLMAMISPNDRMSLTNFSSHPNSVLGFTHSSKQLIEALDTLQARGGSAIYDSLRTAYDQFALQRELDSHLRMIVFITDGGDKNSNLSLENLLSWLATSPITSRIRLYLIALNTDQLQNPENMGTPTNFSDLREIAKRSNAFYYEITPDRLGEPFHEIQQHF